MAWVAPVTFVTGAILTAAQLNTFLRDNMNCTAPAKSLQTPTTATGYHFVSSGLRAITTRSITKNSIDIIENSPASDSQGSYGDLATVGPSCTVTTGTKALAFYSIKGNNSLANVAVFASIEVTGATTIDARDSIALIIDGQPVGGNAIACSQVYLFQNLTPGLNTFRMKYRNNSGVATYTNRHLCMMAL